MVSQAYIKSLEDFFTAIFNYRKTKPKKITYQLDYSVNLKP